jgi:hypothetical protein
VEGRSAAYAATVRSERGGIATKLIVGIFLVAVVGSAVLYLLIRSDDPLGVSADATVQTNQTLRQAEVPDGSDVALVRGGEVWVATTVRNDGRFAVRFDGLGELGEVDDVPYIPTKLLLGDGTEADPTQAAPFVPLTLDPGEGVGVLVIYQPNPDLLCQLFPDEAVGKGSVIDGFPVQGTVFGVSVRQELTADEPYATVAAISRSDCEATFADL